MFIKKGIQEVINMTEDYTKQLVSTLSREMNEATSFESTDKFNSASDDKKDELVSLIYKSQDLINRFEIELISQALKAADLEIYANEITLFTNLMKSEMAAL